MVQSLKRDPKELTELQTANFHFHVDYIFEMLENCHINKYMNACDTMGNS